MTAPLDTLRAVLEYGDQSADAPDAEQELRRRVRALEAAAREVLDDVGHGLLVIPPDAGFDSGSALARAYVDQQFGDLDDPEVRPQDAAVARRLGGGAGEYNANELRRMLRNSEHSLRSLATTYAQQLRQIHQGQLPSVTGSGLDQERRELAANVARIQGMVDGLISAAHLPMEVVLPETEEPEA